MRMNAIGLYRLAKRLQALGVPLLPHLLRKACFYLHSSCIPLEVEIGEGTELGYGGLGVVIHKDARIGRHCLISQFVTIGGRSGRAGAPTLGDCVRIGAGAHLLGRIRIGDFAVIGANAVVLDDVAPGAVVVGVPAREIRREKDPAAAYAREMGRPAPLHPAAEPPVINGLRQELLQ